MRKLPALNLGPRYRALSLLARGGMGAVYLGQRFVNGKSRAGADDPPHLVAIKVMHGYIADRPETVAMFIDEARIGTRIQHPNVVQVLDTDVADDTPFIVMEYVEGLSLSRLLRAAEEAETAGGPARTDALPIDVLVAIVRDALLGLAAAHDVGIVHRDVSPHNILVGVDGRARITDFGVATYTGRISATAPGEVRGKLGYMSPEQVSRGDVDARADVFAAGIVLWEALTGRDLFSASTQAETLARILRDPIPPPSVVVDVPEALEDACLKALERAKDRRHPDATTFAAAIAAAVTPASPERVRAVLEAIGRDSLTVQREAREEATGLAFEALFADLPPVVLASEHLETRPRTAMTAVERDDTTTTTPRDLVPPKSGAGRRRARIALVATGAIGLLVVGTVFGRVSSDAPPASASPNVAAAAIPPPAAADPPITISPGTVSIPPGSVPLSATSSASASPTTASVAPSPHKRRIVPRPHPPTTTPPSAGHSVSSPPAPATSSRGPFVPAEL